MQFRKVVITNLLEQVREIKKGHAGNVFFYSKST